MCIRDRLYYILLPPVSLLQCSSQHSLRYFSFGSSLHDNEKIYVAEPFCNQSLNQSFFHSFEQISSCQSRSGPLCHLKYSWSFLRLPSGLNGFSSTDPFLKQQHARVFVVPLSFLPLYINPPSLPLSPFHNTGNVQPYQSK